MGRKILYILYQPYKWLIFIPFLAINTLLFGVIAVIVSSLINQRIGSYFGGVVWSRLNALLTPMFVTVKGKENILPCTSYVVIPNHQSLFDIFLIYGWLGLDIKWVMKKELAKIPGIGFGSKKVGHIFIDRSNSKAAMDSLQAARQKLRNGTSVVIFPEGTRSRTGQLIPFKRGGFKLALELNLPILPVTLVNTRRILPPDSLNLLPGKARMVIHKAIPVSGYDEKNMPELIQLVRDTIESALPAH
ncbi:MAG: 1-acyl-sn-glycerol-3-phosphate acyltransferase [Bacteroidales bacterium]|nr:1-acyl-sn-glycerol-3-phosphate acyltransferase [Bacteroidales bacterium]